MTKPTPEHFDIFAAHCMATLPADLPKRKIALNCLQTAMPKTSNVRLKVYEMLCHLEAADKIQQEFIFSK